MRFEDASHRPASFVRSFYRAGARIVMDIIDVSPRVAVATFAAVLAIAAAAIVYFVRSAPPTRIAISAGPESGLFYKNALGYAKVLARSGVRLEVRPSRGSVENLRRLFDPKASVDLAIVQSGISGEHPERLMSLGTLSHQPLFLFYRGKPIELISELAGKKIAVGPPESGTRFFATAILGANGIKEGGATQFADLEGESARAALLGGDVDAAFLMSESLTGQALRELTRAMNLQMYSYKQATAYSRRLDYLSAMDLPEGGFDFGMNIPNRDVALLGPTVELVARRDLHPAISDLVLEAATEIHSRPTLFQRRGEYPAPIEHSIKLSDDSSRFFKSGKSFLYRYMPFWLASLLSRALLVLLPTIVILIPALKAIPALFRWRVQRRIHLRYRELLEIERDIVRDGASPEAHRGRLDAVERAVNAMRVPPSFADQFYGLRGHIEFVRRLSERLN